MPSKKNLWSPKTTSLIKELHSSLRLNEKNWHQYKNSTSHRTAELLASALSQIINDGKKADIQALIEQSLCWIKEEVRDPGCPSH